MQLMSALVQFEHGDLLLQRTFLRRQVTQLREVELGGSAAAWRGNVAAEFLGSGGSFGELLLAGKIFSSSGEAEGNDIVLRKEVGSRFPHSLESRGFSKKWLAKIRTHKPR